jgi:xanthine dehydrogenase YagS FAD-binding subunit
MIDFDYVRAGDVAEAIREKQSHPSAKFIAGGTNLLDLMKYEVEEPQRLIDISRLPLTKIDETDAGGVLIGALVPNSDLAYHPQIQARYPLLASARPSCATWPRPAAISSSAPAAIISMMR